MAFSALEQKTLQVAKGFLGVREATGHNDGTQVNAFQRYVARGAAWLLGQPWCVCFVIYCVKKAAGALGVTSRLPLTASSSELYRWYLAHGLLLAKPKPGCVGLVRGGKTGHEHAFLVHDVDGETLVTVEGNWGDAVRWNRRRVEGCDFGVIC